MSVCLVALFVWCRRRRRIWRDGKLKGDHQLLRAYRFVACMGAAYLGESLSPTCELEPPSSRNRIVSPYRLRRHANVVRHPKRTSRTRVPEASDLPVATIGPREEVSAQAITEAQRTQRAQRTPRREEDAGVSLDPEAAFHRLDDERVICIVPPSYDAADRCV